MSSTHPLADMLDLAVPLRIMMLEARGGPSDTDWELVQMYGADSLNGADAALFGGESGQVNMPVWFDCLAHSIAVMAFLPGGVRLFGRHYQAQATYEPWEDKI